MLNGVITVGVCCAAANKDISKSVLDALADIVKSGEKYRMLIFQCFGDMFYSSGSNDGESSIFSLINYDMLDAMIIVPASIHDRSVIERIVNDCRECGVPLISVDIPLPGAFCISFGYGEAFGKIVEHVISRHDCRRIKLIAGCQGNPFSDTRIKSCREIMRRHGLALGDGDIYYGDFWDGPTYAAMDRFFESGEELPDAFVCCNDTMAMAVCLKLSERGIKIPDDVIVTGFDGIAIEKYHRPRLTTAARNDAQLACTLLEIVDKVYNDRNLAPYTVELPYEPVFSESCGCACRDEASPNAQLAEYVKSYSYSLNYEEYINIMENTAAADPVPENIRKVLEKYCCGNSMVCLTDEFCKFLSAERQEPLPEFSRFGEMHVFACTNTNGRKDLTGMVFPASRIIPQFDAVTSEDRMTFLIPLFFQNNVHGYFVTPYVRDEHHSERLYTFCNSLNRCLENMRTHEHMRALNRRLEFMFTHDQLTQIYNRYGFYQGFREEYMARSGGNCDVFIVSADMNDMKYINDNFGHAEGDEALCMIARALSGASESVGGGVICSRFGGDEFVAAKICQGDAAEQAEKYRCGFAERLSEINAASGKEYQVQVGFGVYSASISGVESIDGLIELADRLMYSDKAKHKRHPRN